MPLALLLRFATGPKRSGGTRWGPKNEFFLSRVDGASMSGGRANGILSIPARVSLGSPRVGTIHVQAPTPRAPPLQAFLAEFSQQRTVPAISTPRFASRTLSGALARRRIDGVCGAGDYPPPDLPREASRSRSAPKKVCNLDRGAPFPSKTSITRGPPVVAVAVSSDPILPHR